MSKSPCLLLLLAGLTLAGCQSTKPSAAETQNRQAIAGIQKQLDDAQNPHAAVPAIREYVLEKMEDLTDAEEQIINSTEPKISANYEQTEYSFVWKVDAKKKKYVEVLTSPAPFMPLGSYRVNRTYYP